MRDSRHDQKIRAAPRRRPGAFTLIELLVVLMIATVLLSLLYTVVTKSRSQAMEGQAKAEIKALEGAILSYRTANGRYPLQVQGTNDSFYLTNNMRVVSLLASNDARNRVHLRVPPGRLTDVVYRDPWGFPYAIAMDEDGDGYVRLRSVGHMYTNRAGAAGVLSVMWTNTYLVAPVGVFSLKGLGPILNSPNAVSLRSWD